MRVLHRTMAAVALAAGVAFATGRPSTAADPATGPTTAPATQPAADPAVAALIQQLDADDWQARDAAAEQLVAKGEAARGAVADAAAHAASPEARSRAAGVVAKLDQLVAERPTRVTMHLADATPQAVFAELGRQAGVRPNLVPPAFWAGQRGGKVSVDIVDQPFWAAVDEVCGKCGGVVQDFGQGGDLTIYPGNGDPLLRGPQSAQGRLTVVARSYVRTRQVSYADGARQAADTLTVVALLDPKLRMVDGTGPTVAVTAATDDKGTPLDLPANAANAAIGPAMPLRAPALARLGRARVMGGVNGMVVNRGFGNGPLRDLTISLKPPAAGATKIAVLKGTVTATVVGQQETLRVDDAANAGHVVRTAGPYTLELNRCDVTGGGVSYDLTVRTAAGAAAAEVPPQIRLEDADGQTIDGSGSRSLSGEDGGYHMTGTITVRGPIKGPIRIVWDVPTRMRTVTLPFELHDLPLPPA